MVDVQEIKKVVSEISGRRSKECYFILCYAVYVARKYQPAEPRMKLLCAEVRREVGKKKDNTVSKALSRAVDDIWQYGDRSKLNESYGRPILERPSPKEIVNRLAQYMWKEPVKE